MTLSELSSVLWRERELLELLLFKLEAEQLLLAGARHEWVPRATREVEMVLERIGETEIHRAAIVAEVGTALGLGIAPSLRILADASPEPWRTLLHEHKTAFLELTDRITAAAESNRELIASARRTADRLLQSVTDVRDDGIDPASYGRDGTPTTRSSRRSVLVDREF